MTARFSLILVVMTVMTIACAIQVPSTAAPTPTVTPTAAPTSSPTDEVSRQSATVRAALVNVRAEPEGEVVGQLEAGTDVRVIECGDDPDEPDYQWCQIVEPAGWVFQGCLSIADGQGCEAK
jgi:hypothetical protein